MRIAGRVLALLTLGCIAQQASAQVLNNGRLRFGNGVEDSINVQGNLRQPFYRGAADQWFKLTYSSYALDSAIGVGGDGASDWNIGGVIVQNPLPPDLTIDSSGFVPLSGNVGYGRLIASGTVTVGTATLQVRNTYVLAEDKSYIRFTTRLTNVGGEPVSNVRMWVGTRDDYVGLTDRPTKTRGTLEDDGFVALSSAGTRAPAIRITSGSEGVLFYSSSPKAHTTIASCCSFASAYMTNPAIAAITATNDGSYALYVRLNDLAVGESDEFTWYYAAGAISELTTIVDDLVEEVVSNVPVTAEAGAGGAITPADATVPPGSTVEFTVTPDANYHIASVEGCDGSLSGNVFTTGAITSACHVSATFELNSYDVTAAVAAGSGSIADTSATVVHGETAAFTVTPATGFAIASVTGCDGTLSGNTYTTGPITAACQVEATFELITYDVTAAVGAGNGLIAPSSATVAHGQSTAFTVTPSTGFVLESVTGCDGSLSGDVYTTGQITEACAVTASFRALHTLVASAQEGGSISPASVQALEGQSVSFTVTPDAGFSITSVGGSCAGTLSGNVYHIANVTSSCELSASFAMTPPTFEGTPPFVFDMNSTELLTRLPDAARPSAVDYLGAPVEVTPVGGQDRYAPGSHTLTWRAVDSRGAMSEIEQTLRVWPTVTLGPDLSIGARVGNYDSFRIALNGLSPIYPFTVHYFVSGDAQGTTLESGQATFEEGEVETEILFAVQVSAPAGSPERTVQISLDEQSNRGSERPLTVTLTTLNQVPTVNLQIEQAGEDRRVVTRDDGPITFRADVHDPDTSDAHSVEWRVPAGTTYTVEDDSLTVQPSSLSVGVNHFEVVVTDNGTPSVTTSRAFDVVVLETAPELPEDATRLLPTGLPDSPAFSPVASNVLPERSGDLTQFLMESEPGTRLALGPYALYRGGHQAELPVLGGLQVPEDSVVNVGGYFDFEIGGLPRAGASVDVVIPQRTPIPAQPVYRKYDPRSNRWQTFVEDIDNRLASAPGAEGHCPPPSSAEYRSGLNPGDWCVRLTIKDGGVNDADGAENGAVSDPGGVGVLSSVQVTGQSKGGGGGSFDVLLVLAAGCLLMLKVMSRRHRRTMLVAAFMAVCLVGVQARADDSTSWYVGGLFGSARSDVGAGALDAALASQGHAVTSKVSNKSREAFRLYAGYQLTGWLGLEAGYSDLGEVDVAFSGAIADVEQFLIDANALQPPSAEGFDLSAVARMPLGDRVSVYARAGAFYWDARYDTRNIDGEFLRRKDDDLSALVGVGAQLLYGRWGIGADFIRFDVDDDVDFVGMNVTYRW